MAWFYFSNLFSFLEILPKIRSVWKLEREEKRFLIMWENCHSSDFQLQWKLDFRMNGLNFEKLVDLAHPALGKYDTQLRKQFPLRNDKILDKIYRIYPCLFFSLAISCKCFYF